MRIPNLASALDKYRREVSIIKKGYEQEKHRLNVIARSPLGRKRTNTITSVDIAAYRDDRLASLNPKTGQPLSTATVRKEMSLLSSFFKIAEIEWGYCDSNPVQKVRKPPSPPGRERRPSSREMRQILSYTCAYGNPQLYSIIVLAVETCMRQGEILGMDWQHINLRNRTIHIPMSKNGSKRDVPMSLRAREALIRLGVKDQGKVFNYTSAGIKTIWRQMMIALNIDDLHFHDLRHEGISRLVELGTLSILEISAISGHKSLNMLKRYTHLSARRLVHKLEGNKHRGKQLLLDYLVPYPAIVEKKRDVFIVKLLDFDGTEAAASDTDSAVRLAELVLMKKLVLSIRDSVPIPPPDQYLELVDRSRIIMINPLPAVGLNT